MKDNLLAILLVISILLNAATLGLFGNIFVNLWDDAMNNILISRSDFDAMVLWGFLFMINTIFTVFMFGFIFGKHGLKGEYNETV